MCVLIVAARLQRGSSGRRHVADLLEALALRG